MKTIEIYIDGACRNNGVANNIGAYSYIMTCNDLRASDVIVEHNVTNNQMELKSAIYALSKLNDAALKYSIIVYSDSQYVVNGVNTWYKDWEAKGFKKVKNVDLWKSLMALVRKFDDIQFIWVKGHDSNPGNIEVDKLCNVAMDAYNIVD